MKEPTKKIIIGIIQNFLVLFGNVIVYSAFIRHLMSKYEWAERSFGEFWFFLLLMLVFPAINILRKKKYLVIGNLLGIVVFFLFALLVMMLAHVIFGWH